MLGNKQQQQNIALLGMPRIVEPYIRHIPHPTQQVFLSLNKYKEVFFGGAGGGGMCTRSLGGGGNGGS